MAKDPVCGMEVDEATARHTAQYDGWTYYVCAPGCKKAFAADPQRYLSPGHTPSMGGYGDGDGHGDATPDVTSTPDSAPVATNAPTPQLDASSIDSLSVAAATRAAAALRSRRPPPHTMTARAPR